MLLPSQKGDGIELDELWSFMAKKAQEVWHWLALCRRTRQIVPYAIGDRSEEGARGLRGHGPGGYRRCATRSDFWLAYENVFPQRIHRFCGKETGKTSHTEHFFGTIRARLSRLVRRSYSFSKNVERHLPFFHLLQPPHSRAVNDQ